MSTGGAPGHNPSGLKSSIPAIPTGFAHRPWWGVPIAVIAVIVIAVFGAIGIHGLTENPVGTTRNGVTTLTGNFQPFNDCGKGCVDGYIQAGGRDVFVRLPKGCPEPENNGLVVVHGRIDPALGSAAYLAQGCAIAQP